MLNQDGLEWVHKAFGLEPRWTKNPDIDTISRITRKHLGVKAASIEIKFHAQGAFNKLYKVSTPDLDCLMRVSLPVEPHCKTESEVATIENVRKESDMPVPQIIAFDSNSSNELGFEWILMEMMPGTTLKKGWRKMSWAAKEDIVKQLAKYQHQLFQKRFNRIGNIFPQHNSIENHIPNENKQHNTPVTIGAIVSLIFFWGDHLTHDVPRGPFEYSLDWLQARLKFVLNDQERILTQTDDEDDIKYAEFALNLAQDLAQVLPTVFPADPAKPESTILFHTDLSMQNIMVNADGELTAVIDWECVSAVPLWRACTFPHLLESRPRDEKPSQDNYAPASDDGEDGSSEFDNEGINQLYWDHLLEFEQTQLRHLFLSEMEMRSPEWVAVKRESELKGDFEKAVHNCDNGWVFRRLKKWLDAYKDGRIGSLTEQLTGNVV